VYLKVLPMRRLRSFKVRGKLAPRFIGPDHEGERRIQGKVFESLFRSIRISEMRFILRGVGLSHPKISNFGM
jgi:hypothetical protein